jgi:hypothetical protein
MIRLHYAFARRVTEAPGGKPDSHNIAAIVTLSRKEVVQNGYRHMRLTRLMRCLTYLAPASHDHDLTHSMQT